MSVYKEGYEVIENYFKSEKRIYNDACDVGVQVNKNDKVWNQIKQVINLFQEEETRKVNEFGVSVEMSLLDEWSYSEGNKTAEEALDKFLVSYFINSNKNHPSLIEKGFDGFFNIQKIN